MTVPQPVSMSSSLIVKPLTTVTLLETATFMTFGLTTLGIWTFTAPVTSSDVSQGHEKCRMCNLFFISPLIAFYVE